MQKYDIAIIGGGAAGIMAAIFASQNNKKVVLIEKNDILGRKILATGNGRCNLTNKNMQIDRLHGALPEHILAVINQFDADKTMHFFENIGLLLKEEDNGRIFPRTNSAKSVVDVLSHKLYDNNVEVKLGCTIKAISKNNDFFELSYGNNDKLISSKLIITTGGKAAHFLGSSGDGIYWAQNLGHSIKPIYASLVPVETNENFVKDIQGLKMFADVSVYSGDDFISKRTGDLLFTHFGVSGPAIMSQSREIAPLVENGQISIKIDLLPDCASAELDLTFKRVLEMNGKKILKNVLIGIIPENLISVILKISDINPNKKSAEVSKSERQEIIYTIKCLVLTVSKLRSLKEAQVSTGGVDLSEVDPNTMQSKIIDNLYFAGEVLDVDGDSGGFNLQWAWSSGYVAGRSVGK